MTRLKTHITVGAMLRTAEQRGLFATVARKGDPDAGVLYVKLLRGREAALWSQGYEGDWRPRTEGLAPEAEVDAIIAKELAFDRDLWVLEMEGEGGEAVLAAF